MRIAHILRIDAKGEAACVARGPYETTKAKFAELKLGKGETLELWSPGWLPKKRTQGKLLDFTKKEPTSKEALAADLLKQGKSKEDIDKALAASKLPSIKDAVKKAAAIIGLLFLFGFNATAQEPIINKLVSTTVAGATTNSSQANGVMGWNIDQVAVLQVAVVGTNASPTNAIRITFDTSDNGTDWSADAYSHSVTPTGTSSATSLTRITNTVGGKYIRFGKVENANLTAVTISRYTMSLKER